jgi:hypothetical protein
MPFADALLEAAVYLSLPVVVCSHCFHRMRFVWAGPVEPTGEELMHFACTCGTEQIVPMARWG